MSGHRNSAIGTLTVLQGRSLGYARDDGAKRYQNFAAFPYDYAPYLHSSLDSEVSLIPSHQSLISALIHPLIRQRLNTFAKIHAVAAVKAMPGAAAMSIKVRPFPRRKYITTRASTVPMGPEMM